MAAGSTRIAIKDALRRTLEDLSHKEFKNFKKLLNECSGIPWSKLENADDFETVDFIVEAHTEADSGEVVVKILKNMKLNQKAKDLEEKINAGSAGSSSPETYRPRKQMAEGLGKGSDAETTLPAKTGSEVLCSLHSEKLKLFCLEDKQPLCVVCRDSSVHREHNCCPIEEGASRMKEGLKNQLEPLQKILKGFEETKVTCDETAQHIQIQTHNTEKQIKQEFEKLHQFLRDEEAARIAALKTEEEQKSQMIKRKSEKISKEISSLSDTIRAIEEGMKADDVTFLQNYKRTMERTQSTAGMDCDQEVDVDFSSQKKTLRLGLLNTSKDFLTLME
ncbi:E3 ubiquitin-protein ligase TRIM7-like isoform X2 [Engraulis encrasicolus]|uniref:E3 ubiquitin-protein ligase TRIM7-like isoform X2 n=1 Tax=Engraulis encrasicolus TaxID=184585 RepID=UPI002FD729C2